MAGEGGDALTDRPIIFSAPMIQALLAGRKTQTRRLIRLGKGEWIENGEIWAHFDDGPDALPKPYRPGDRLYVREAHAFGPLDPPPVIYRATAEDDGWEVGPDARWRPSIHMPRCASRLTLTVTEVRVQRLQEISAADSIAEGVQCETCTAMGQSACHERGCFASIDSYRTLWNSLHGPDAWATNPWVVAVSFTVQHGNIDAVKANA